MPRINFTHEEKGGSKFVLKPGVYEVCLVDFKWGTSEGAKTKGAPVLHLKLETHEGSWVFDQLIFHPSTAWKASAMLRCFGLEFAEGQEIDLNDELLHTIVGRSWGNIRVKNEEYQGKVLNRLESYLPTRSSEPAPVDPF